MKNATNFKVFSQPCTEYIDKIAQNYTVFYDNTPKKSKCFQKTMIDEQIILHALENETIIDPEIYQSILDGCDSTYPDSSVYFIPKDLISQAKAHVTKIVEDWKSGNNEMGYSSLGSFYIAYKYTKSGMWILTYDETTSCAFSEFSNHMFDNVFNVTSTMYPKKVKSFDLNKVYLTQSPEEESGETFLKSLKRDPIMQLMKDEEFVIIKAKKS